MSTLLVVDDDRAVLHLVAQAFTDTEVKGLTASTGADCLAALRQHHPDVILLDIMLPGTSGLDVFRQIHEIDPRLPVVFITAGGTSDTVIEAMKLGAHDYLMKPLNLARIQQLVSQALEMRRLMHVQVSIPEAELKAYAQAGDMLIGRSPEMQEVYKAVGRVAPQDVTVLIRGESGTGKELVARAIYHHSKRATKSFLAVNCAAITESLLESELFGYEKGAFTGADQRRIGKFEQCNGGTIFLDEVGDMSPLVQSKVLRVLQEQRFERVGGNETIHTDVRIIAATNRDLEAMVNDGRFRSDLYYRLNGFTIDLPPLRKHTSDLVVLIEYFLARFSRELGKEPHTIAPEAMAMLTRYPWPGNVRELQSVLRQSLLQATGPVIIPDFLPETVRGAPIAPRHAAPEGLPVDELQRFIDRRLEAGSNNLYAEALELMEKYLLTRVLRLTEGNQSKAAALLGITRGSLRNKIRILGISIDQIVRIENQPPSHLDVR